MLVLSTLVGAAVVAREVLVVKDTVVARGSPKASSNDFVADERVLEGPADLAIYNGLQIGFYAHLGQADRTFHNRPGSLNPATPPPYRRQYSGRKPRIRPSTSLCARAQYSGRP